MAAIDLNEADMTANETLKTDAFTLYEMMQIIEPIIRFKQ